MDSLFHFVFGFIAALALDLHKRHKLWFVLVAAFMGVFIDFDHFLGVYPLKPFHNVFIAILLPLLLFYAVRRFGKGWRIWELERFFLIVTAMLSAHLIADMFFDPEKLFYPLSNVEYSFLSVKELIPAGWEPFVSPLGIALLVYAVVLVVVMFVEDVLYFREARRHSMTHSMEEALDELV